MPPPRNKTNETIAVIRWTGVKQPATDRHLAAPPLGPVNPATPMTDDTQLCVSNGPANVLKWAGVHQRFVRPI